MANGRFFGWFIPRVIELHLLHEVQQRVEVGRGGAKDGNGHDWLAVRKVRLQAKPEGSDLQESKSNEGDKS